MYSTFEFNCLSEEEIRGKLPKTLIEGEYAKAFVKDLITMQNLNYNIELITPENTISKKTTRIEGRMFVENARAEMRLLDKYGSLEDVVEIKTKIDKDGKFVFDDIDLSKTSQIEIHILLFSEALEAYYWRIDEKISVSVK